MPVSEVVIVKPVFQVVDVKPVLVKSVIEAKSWLWSCLADPPFTPPPPPLPSPPTPLFLPPPPPPSPPPLPFPPSLPETNPGSP
ncbi:unnamed protein product [Closterium sp. NIES-54]